MKIKKRIIIISAVCLLLIGATLFLLSHQVHFKYNDWWVIGKSMSEIEDRYGEFDTEYRIGYTNYAGYYLHYDNYNEPCSNHIYHIEFDENGIAIDVHEGKYMNGI